MINNDELFQKVCEDHITLIWHISRSYERNNTLAEDLVQDILLAVWRSLPKLQDQAKLKPYIARIAQNRAITHVTRVTKMPTPSPIETVNIADDAPTAVESIEKSEKDSLLRRCLEQLSPKLRRVAVLALDGFANKEIALSIGEKPNTIAVKLRRAKALLTLCVSGGTND